MAKITKEHLLEAVRQLRCCIDEHSGSGGSSSSSEGTSVSRTEITLWEGSLSSTGTATLSQSVTDFDEIVVVTGNDTYGDDLPHECEYHYIPKSEIVVPGIEHNYAIIKGLYGSNYNRILFSFTDETTLTISIFNTNTDASFSLVKVIGIKYTASSSSSSSGSSSSFDVYSEEERVVGVWIDNKPLYQKTFAIDCSASSPNVMHEITDTSEFDTLVYLDGTFTRVLNDIRGKVEARTESPTDSGYGVVVKVESNKLVYNIYGYSIGDILKVYLTIKYTKTTDVAGDIPTIPSGSGTSSTLLNYSTEEQCVGTWIDGKPLYQRVVQADTSANAGAFYWVDLDDTNTCVVNVPSIYCRVPSAPDEWHSVGNGVMGFQYNLDNTHPYGVRFFNATYAVTGIRMIVQYTKTTD